MSVGLSVAVGRALKEHGFHEDTTFYAENAVVGEDTSSRQLRSGRVIFYKPLFSGILVTKSMDRALVASGVPHFKVHIDWELDVVVYQFGGDRGTWAVRNFTDDPAKKDHVEMVWSEVDADLTYKVLAQVLSEIEKLFVWERDPSHEFAPRRHEPVTLDEAALLLNSKQRISPDSLQSIPAPRT